MFPIYVSLPLSSKLIMYKDTKILYISEKFKIFQLSIISDKGCDEKSLNEIKIVYSLDIPYSSDDYMEYDLNFLNMENYNEIIDGYRLNSFFVLEIENEHELAKFKLLSTDYYELFDSNQIFEDLQYKCQRML